MTQNEALSILKTGANVFLTGEPGSGKTHTVNIYIRYLREHGIGVAVTASTGIAATHIGGMTIHSWSGIGIKKILLDADLDKLRRTARLASRAQKTSVLVIDEISMLDAQTLTAIDTALKVLRGRHATFGGLQVVFVGDFFQLPPVVRKEGDFTGFVFESHAWQEAHPVVCYLSEQYRTEDIKFVRLLSAIRKGNNIGSVYRFLSSRKVEVEFTQMHTRLYSHNIDVDRVNEQKLKSLPGEEVEYQMTSRGNKKLVEQLKKSCLSPEVLVLKKETRVMFTKNNFEEGFVNGTLGEVVGFSDDNLPVVLTKSGLKIEAAPMEWPVEDNGRTLASITQVPLRLAWAITVHKSQGMTLDAAAVDLSGAFEYGQGYVALSRVRTLSGLFLLGLNNKALEVHPDISQADITFRLKSEKARNFLSKYSQLELSGKQNEFILSSGGSPTKVAQKSKVSTYEQTLQMYKAGKNISEIASARDLKESTIINHFEKLKEDRKLTGKELVRIIPQNFKKELSQIHIVFHKLNTEKLSPVFEKLSGKYSYDELRLARLVMNYLK